VYLNIRFKIYVEYQVKVVPSFFLIRQFKSYVSCVYPRAHLTAAASTYRHARDYLPSCTALPHRHKHVHLSACFTNRGVVTGGSMNRSPDL